MLFLVIPSKCVATAVVKEITKAKLAPYIPTGAPMTVVKEIADTLPLVLK